MFTLTLQADTYEGLLAKIAEAAGGTKPGKPRAAPAASTSGVASTPVEQNDTSAVNEAPKDEAPAGMTPEEFSKNGMTWAKAMDGTGTAAKAMFKELTEKLGYEINRFGVVKPEHYETVLARMAELTQEKELA